MYQKIFVFDRDSYLELSTRIVNAEEQVLITLVGPKNENQITASQAVLTKEKAQELYLALHEVINHKSNWEQLK